MKSIGIMLMLSLCDRLDAAPENLMHKFNPDVILSTPEMIRKARYPVEEHVIKTEDGYLLTLHRIPGGKNSLPVLLQHAITSCSADWILLGKNKALAYLLADQGYDVWLGNSRGNSYSRAHISLSPSNSTFWDFSFHDIGIHDLPAMITFITNMRSQPLHAYIGHSMGTTSFYVMASKRPEIAGMVNMMISLAPAAFIEHMKTALRYLAPSARKIQAVMDAFYYGEFLNNNWNKLFVKFVNQNSFAQELCANVIFSICGYDYEQLNYILLPDIVGHSPAGGSTKMWIHYVQMQQSGKFRQYDYGRVKNVLTYRSIEPPEYDLANITVPIALFYGKNDWLVDPVDVKRLYNLLPNVIDMYEVPWSNFNHVDFVYAKDAPKLVYERIFKIIRKRKPINVKSVE